MDNIRELVANAVHAATCPELGKMEIVMSPKDVAALIGELETVWLVGEPKPNTICTMSGLPVRWANTVEQGTVYVVPGDQADKIIGSPSR